jgi:TonB family protein
MLPDKTQKTSHMKLLIIILCLLALTAEVEGQTRRRKSAPAAPVLPVEADASRLPPGYVGHNAAVIFAALRERRAQFRKGQFETTPEYESRVERIVSSLPAASARLTFLLRDAKVTYDADSSSFKITVETDYLFPDTYVAGDWSSPYGRFTSVYLVWNSRTVGSGVGQNAFGVRKRYKITAYTSLRLAVPSESISRLTRGLQLPATPASARVMYPGIRLALTGRLIPPYGGEETEVDEATISEPEEAHYFKYYVYFEPDAAIVYDIRTGEVYGSLDLTKAGTDKNTVLSYSEAPTTLEDPLARQQRLEEQRREYPPEHAFKAAEVTRAAIITSKPEPGFTEEARRDNVSGVVRLRAVLKYDGTVEVVEVIRGLPEGLTERSVEAAKKIRFQPAVRNGRLVSQSVTLEYNFNVY